MEPGLLRHLVTIQRSVETPDDYGEPVTVWQDAGAIWAAKQDLSGRELFAARQVVADVTTQFVVRYRDDLTATMRIVSNGVAYNIVSVGDRDGTKRALHVLTTRVG